jgi:hypothetical protein
VEIGFAFFASLRFRCRQEIIFYGFDGFDGFGRINDTAIGTAIQTGYT